MIPRDLPSPVISAPTSTTRDSSDDYISHRAGIWLLLNGAGLLAAAAVAYLWWPDRDDSPGTHPISAFTNGVWPLVAGVALACWGHSLWRLATTRTDGSPEYTSGVTRHAYSYGAGHKVARDCLPCDPPAGLSASRRRAWRRGWRAGERRYDRFPDGPLDTDSARRAMGAELRCQLDAELGGTLEERRAHRAATKRQLRAPRSNAIPPRP